MLISGVDFAFETTLATKSFKNLIFEAKQKGYKVQLIYFWLNSVIMAEERVLKRVRKGGHNIPKDIIKRRYFRGLRNLFDIYHDICDVVLIYDNSENIAELVYENSINNQVQVYNKEKFNRITDLSD